MNQHWKKLISIFLLLVLVAQSPLHAAVCPCCTIHSILSGSISSSKHLELGCCSRHSPRSAATTPSCCVESVPSNSIDESQAAAPRGCCERASAPIIPCEPPVDCACCAQDPAVASAESSNGKTILVLSMIYDGLQVLVVPRVLSTTTTQPFVPLPLSRRLAMISFWRN